MVNMSAKFDKEICNGLVSIVFTRSSDGRNHARTDARNHSSVTISPPQRVAHPLTMVNTSAKFDKEIHNGKVSIVFTSLFPYMSIVTLTFDL